MNNNFLLLLYIYQKRFFFTIIIKFIVWNKTKSDLKIPNWIIHCKWAKNAGIDKLIADSVNRNIDYGTSWAFTETKNDFFVKEYESNMTKQLKFFHQKDLEEGNDHNSHIKAYYLHHLLDYFKETRINIYKINEVFDQFLKEKIEIEIINYNGKRVNFLKEIHQIFDFLRKNKEELYSDLKGGYFTN